ncbi:pitrilysin family protein [Streptomyces albus]|uniref:M16 family metallopeptidase n=1 Tax=Streptomyces albus TaxID=1888 RepID=UPI00068FF8D8|nr:pitrilysin family protein [Streptomyces albus]
MEQYDAPHGPLSTTRLANGLTVVAQRDPVLRDLHVHLRYDVGSRDEAPGRHGLAHFLEHLMFLGTRRHPDFLETLRRAGARDVNASTNQDRSAFTMTVPRELLRQALDMEADRMTGLAGALDERALADHLALVRREERERCGGPFGDAAKLLFARAYPPGHPYRHPSMGDTDALGRLTPGEVAGFHRRHYRPERATLVVLGDLDPAAVTGTAAETLGGVPGDAGVPPPPEETRAPLRGSPAVARAACPAGVPPRVYTLLHTPPYGSRGHPAYAVLAAVLGLGRGSRLFRSAVRGARIARPAGESLAAWELERGSSLLYGTVTAAPGITGARLLEGVRTVLASVSDGLAPRELQRAVRLVLWRRRAGLDDPARRAEAFAVHTRVTGGAHHAYTAAEAVADVTERAVVRAASRSTAAATFLVYDEAGTVTAGAAR